MRAIELNLVCEDTLKGSHCCCNLFVGRKVFASIGGKAGDAVLVKSQVFSCVARIWVFLPHISSQGYISSGLSSSWDDLEFSEGILRNCSVEILRIPRKGLSSVFELVLEEDMPHDVSESDALALLRKDGIVSRCRGYVLAISHTFHTANQCYRVKSCKPCSEYLLITSSTRIIYQKSLPPLTTLPTTFTSHAETSLKLLLTTLLTSPSPFSSFGLEDPRGALLYGLPGTGKTFTVKKLTVALGISLHCIDGGTLFSHSSGTAELKLRTVFGRAQREEGLSIVYIDEIDAMCPNREKGRNQESRVVAQLLTLMDGIESVSKVFVIAATNRVNAIDMALRRPGRFDREIEFEAPDAEGRAMILRFHMEKLGFDRIHVDIEDIASQAVGYVGADLAHLVREASLEAVQHGTVLKQEHFESAFKKITPSTRRGEMLTLDPVLWEDIGGLEETKRKIRRVLNFSTAKASYGTPKGILLYGPPGCSKTTIAKAIATSASTKSTFAFLSVTGASLYSSFVGESESNIRRIFSKARINSPCVLFIDEIEVLVGKRDAGDTGSDVGKRVLSTFLNEMDGILSASDSRKTVMVLAATNFPEKIDNALLRPGRFDQILYIPPPDQKAREACLRIHSKAMPLCDSIDLKVLSQRLEYFSGADIENLCREAALLALSESFTVKSIVST